MTRAQFDNAAVDLIARNVAPVANLVLPFYRRHPYRGRLWWSEVDLRGAVSPQGRFFYNRLPKNANSSVTAALADALGLTGTAKHAFVRPSRLSAGQVTALDRDFESFVVVRDPYDRTLSAFLEKVLPGKRQATRPLRWFRARGITAPSFEDFCAYLAEGGLYDDNHWAPQTHGLLIPFAAFGTVVRMERLAEDFAALTTRLFGREVALPRRGPTTPEARDTRARHLTPRARAMLTALYAEDLVTLGYPARA
ncbi:MAG: sulfotransferase family protein [Rhodobacteraceae bacterium]|jgi:hypothetical protein|nr:sulfotransferase family protein [Paracoccaceae bacterium]